ncbi:DUF981 family protein [Halocalculus aciditolerans]|uniref:DUF981 family protein n=1 Tax=Halocalculus aciditolerans TaxID=1383812 RepID=A0A830FQG7_9EURY|nr:DUF981 family protein [Halocalculus aciditolerans]GGL70616.1 hypothetical protein GCM10009039_30830 [Halocalculus aciditolerans]
MLPLEATASTADKLILYNTLMGLAAGVGLLLLVGFARYGSTASKPTRDAWAWTFAGLGGLLAALGLHVCLTWPLLGAANIVFGEPALAFGVLLLVTAAVVFRTPIESDDVHSVSDTVVTYGRRKPLLARVGGLRETRDAMPDELLVALRPVTYVGAFAGLMVGLLGVSGAVFGEILFRPPASEFPAGLVAGTGIEAAYMAGTYVVLGLGAMVLPFGFHDRSYLNPAGSLLTLAAVLLLGITFVSFVGHVTLSAGVGPGGIPW